MNCRFPITVSVAMYIDDLLGALAHVLHPEELSALPAGRFEDHLGVGVGKFDDQRALGTAGPVADRLLPAHDLSVAGADAELELDLRALPL
jgi:hypothetical protein